MLMRMTKRKEIKRQVFDLNIPDFFMLNSTYKLKGFDKFKHEKAGADLFVAFYPFISAWSFEPPIGKDRADRGMKIGDTTVYFEVDRCTEGLKIIEKKLDSYIRSNERCNVVFSIVGDDNQVSNRGNKIIPLMKARKRGDQFLLVNHDKLLQDPLGEVLYSPRDEILSFEML